MMAPFPRRIAVRAMDRYGRQLPHAEFQWFVDGTWVGGMETNGQGSIEINEPTALISIVARFGTEKQSVKLAATQDSYEFRFDASAYPYWRDFAMKHFPALVGITFVLVAVTLGFVFDSPTAIQAHLILAMFALGGGGFGGEIAGFIKTDMKLGTKLKISAGGAAAIFVLLYFFVPAGS